MNFRDKTREQIQQALRHKSRDDLVNLIHALSTLEQLYKPSEIAARTHVSKRAILRDLRAGKFGEYYCRAENSLLIPASGVQRWLEQFKVSERKIK